MEIHRFRRAIRRPVGASARYTGAPRISAAGSAAAAAYLALSGGNVATERAFVMVAVMFGAILLDRRALTLPLFPAMADEDVDRVADALATHCSA